ncbi:MAG: hypothetical protein ACFFCC_19750 [Promethearchaeota archaeon]
MPLPMRIDRVFNGEKSVLIRPKEPVIFPITEDLTAIINPDRFLQYGFEKLLYFTEVRSREKLISSLSIERTFKWWNLTKFLYGNLLTLEEDFSAFLRAYLHTIVKAKLQEEDLVNAANEYCDIIADICRKRMEQNSILAEVKGKQQNVKMYKTKEFTYYKKFKRTKETQYHPELIDIEIFDLSNIGFTKLNGDHINTLKNAQSKEIKYIPLLFYDDLLECMLQNIKRLGDPSNKMLDPSFLFDKNVILTQKSNQFAEVNIDQYSWWDSFDNINFEHIIQSIRKNHEEYISTLDIEALR